LEPFVVRHLKVKILVVGGDTARWVERDPDHGDFVTTGEIKAPAIHGQHGPRQVVFESASPEHHGGADPQLAMRRRDAFGRLLAEAINAAVGAGRLNRVGLVAEARMLHEIKAHLSNPARARIVFETAKNLANTPDHALSSWLVHA
jgi:protein required for attachment to host cells